MAQIEPFQAIRYTQPDLSDLVAPPYDVLSAADKDALLERHDQNIVSIDLPHVPPKNAGPDEAYQRAAGELVSWLDTHHLARDPQPAIYAYHQTYKLGDRALTRKMFFARLKLEPLGTGGIFPHEQTFGGPKEDRFKLTQATRCNLSPIFGLYPDPRNDVSRVIDQSIRRDPDATATLDGIQNSLWAIPDPQVIEAVQARLSNLPIYIADGHHRYSTAWMYRQAQVDEIGEPRPDDPVNFVLTAFCGMEDPGATIQPYFRTIARVPQISASGLETALRDAFAWSPIPRPKTDRELEQALHEAGPQSFAFCFPKDDICGVVTPRDSDLLARYEPRRNPAWRSLPYAILHRYVIDEVIGPKLCGGNAPLIHYHKSLREAVTDAAESQGIAVLMPATTLAQLREVCAAGELMPQKSTYFFPKLVTGMVINPLY